MRARIGSRETNSQVCIFARRFAAASIAIVLAAGVVSLPGSRVSADGPDVVVLRVDVLPRWMIEGLIDPLYVSVEVMNRGDAPVDPSVTAEFLNIEAYGDVPELQPGERRIVQINLSPGTNDLAPGKHTVRGCARANFDISKDCRTDTFKVIPSCARGPDRSREPRYCRFPVRWHGTVTGTFVWSAGLTTTWEATAVFGWAGKSHGVHSYRAIVGSVTYRTTGVILGCFYQGVGTYVLEPIDGNLFYRPRRHSTEYSISGFELDFAGQDPKGYPVTFTCPDGHSGVLEYNPVVSWINTGVGYTSTAPDATVLEGGYQETRVNGTLSWAWQLVAD